MSGARCSPPSFDGRLPDLAQEVDGVVGTGLGTRMGSGTTSGGPRDSGPFRNRHTEDGPVQPKIRTDRGLVVKFTSDPGHPYPPGLTDLLLQKYYGQIDFDD